jgi:DNA polymerase-1
MLAIKVLATGNNPVFDVPLGIALAIDSGKAAYIPLEKEQQNQTFDLFSTTTSKKHGMSAKKVFDCLLPILNSQSILKIGHNIKLDMHFLDMLSDGMCRIFPYDDIEVMSYVLDSSSHSHDIGTLSELFLDIKGKSFDEVFGVGKQRINPDNADENVLCDYMCEQVDFVFRLCGILRQRLLNEHMVTIYEHFDRPLVATLFEMEKME